MKSKDDRHVDKKIENSNRTLVVRFQLCIPGLYWTLKSQMCLSSIYVSWGCVISRSQKLFCKFLGPFPSNLLSKELLCASSRYQNWSMKNIGIASLKYFQPFKREPGLLIPREVRQFLAVKRNWSKIHQINLSIRTISFSKIENC